MKARNDHIYFPSSLIFQDFSEESISPKGSDMGKIFLSYNNINIINRNRWVLMLNLVVSEMDRKLTSC